MSVMVSKYLYCDGPCQEPFQSDVEGLDRIDDQRRKAKAEGWHRVREGKVFKDYCARCWAEMHQEKPT